MSDIQSLNICGISDVGRTRTRNEDAFLVGNIVERTGFVSLGLDMKSFSIKEQGFLVAVADGMGGMGGGDVASVLGLGAFSRHYYSRTYPEASPDEVMESIKLSALEAHRTVSETSKKNPGKGNMGTTLVGMTVINGRFYSFNVGDSRLYRFRNGSLKQISKDHSLVQMLIDSGKLSEEEAENFSRKNEITNSIGAGTTCKPEIKLLDPGETMPGDVFLLCSDGLSNMLDIIEMPLEYDALSQLFVQSGAKEKELGAVKKQLCTGEYFDRLISVLEGIDTALSTESSRKVLLEVCESVSRIQAKWQGWQQLLSIFLAEKEQNPIEEIMKQPIDLDNQAKILIDAANDRKSKDNVTAVLMELI